MFLRPLASRSAEPSTLAEPLKLPPGAEPVELNPAAAVPVKEGAALDLEDTVLGAAEDTTVEELLRD